MAQITKEDLYQHIQQFFVGKNPKVPVRRLKESLQVNSELIDILLSELKAEKKILAMRENSDDDSA